MTTNKPNLRAAAIGAGTGLAVFGALSFIHTQPVSRADRIEPVAYPEARDVRPGATLDDSIYAGLSPDTGRPIYAAPKDAPLSVTFDQAQAYCANLDASDHRGWRVPSTAELNVLSQNRAAIGGFDLTGSNPVGWYWSSSRYYGGAVWMQRFSDGHQYITIYRHLASSLRCVRG